MKNAYFSLIIISCLLSACTTENKREVEITEIDECSLHSIMDKIDSFGNSSTRSKNILRYKYSYGGVDGICTSKPKENFNRSCAVTNTERAMRAINSSRYAGHLDDVPILDLDCVISFYTLDELKEKARFGDNMAHFYWLIGSIDTDSSLRCDNIFQMFDKFDAVNAEVSRSEYSYLKSKVYRKCERVDLARKYLKEAAVSGSVSAILELNSEFNEGIK